MRLVALATAAILTSAQPLRGQGVSASVATLLESELASQIGLGYVVPPMGPVLVSLGALRLGASTGDRWGAGLDLALRLGHDVRLYPVAGLAAGWGSGTVEGTWGSWSAGLGYEFLRGKGLGMAVEGRYLRLSNPGDAVALGLRMGFRFAPSTPEAPAAALRTAGSAARDDFTAGVIQSALDLMGTPYVWGGTDANGFDCSGLIQYAFRRHGVELPRTSREQSQVGVEVGKDTLGLLPGDILTFAQQGSRVSHVGLYLGDGQFIHSSSSGVQVSHLRPEDPDGRYWWRRWIGARRVAPATGP